jgi:hypothetical protein
VASAVPHNHKHRIKVICSPCSADQSSDAYHMEAAVPLITGSATFAIVADRHIAHGLR